MASCEIGGISCGSVVIDSNIGVEQNEDSDAAEVAPTNQQEFLQQISGIVNDTQLSK